jgi:DIM1 family U5 snRNP protein
MAELKHLTTAWDVDRFIVLEEEKVVAVRFGAHEICANDADDVVYEHHCNTMLMDGALAEIATKVRNFCTIYAVDTNVVPEFNEMFELNDPREPFALMFFFRNKHIKTDLSTGNNNKINFVVEPEDLIDIIEVVYLEGKKGRGLVVPPKKFPHAAIAR